MRKRAFSLRARDSLSLLDSHVTCDTCYGAVLATSVYQAGLEKADWQGSRSVFSVNIQHHLSWPGGARPRASPCC